MADVAGDTTFEESTRKKRCFYREIYNVFFFIVYFESSFFLYESSEQDVKLKVPLSDCPLMNFSRPLPIPPCCPSRASYHGLLDDVLDLRGEIGCAALGGATAAGLQGEVHREAWLTIMGPLLLSYKSLFSLRIYTF